MQHAALRLQKPSADVREGKPGILAFVFPIYRPVAVLLNELWTNIGFTMRNKISAFIEYSDEGVVAKPWKSRRERAFLRIFSLRLTG